MYNKTYSDRVKELAEILQLKKQGEYYLTTWGKKTEIGLEETIRNILQLSVEVQENADLKGKLHRRNMQIKELREEINSLAERLREKTIALESFYGKGN